MKVLSLFDGLSCGQIALDQLGIEVDTYYASEIDPYAIKVTQHNYPNTIQLGDVTKWKEWDIDWSSIALIQAGSPCQGFSFSGKQLAFDDPRSVLFFEFVNILNHIKEVNPNVKFLLENVNMKQEFKDTITQFVKVPPIEINSNLVSAQNRKRLYWTNIEGVTVPEDRGIVLTDILEDQVAGNFYVSEKQLPRLDMSLNPTIGGVKGCFANPVVNTNKSECLLARDYKGIPGRQNFTMAIDEKGIRRLTPVEYERLQTVPEDYTNCVSSTQRFKMLGNGWTVEVIKHIYQNL